jgi:hypothetical protein
MSDEPDVCSVILIRADTISKLTEAVSEKAKFHARELENLADWIDGIAYYAYKDDGFDACARVSRAIEFLRDLGGKSVG